MILLGDRAIFPPVEFSDPDGLLAVGGDISLPWLEKAYAMGIFPWYSRKPILWWSPDPRFVLFPEKLKISKSLSRTIAKQDFVFRADTDFRLVMENCQKVKRSYEEGTWIQDEMIVSYTQLFEKGMAHCASVYRGGQMVGGLYGVQVGKVFCGESMFHLERDMSKVCFALYVQYLQKQGIALIDCQVYTDHLSSLGADHISRKEFVSYLGTYDAEGKYEGETLEF